MRAAFRLVLVTGFCLSFLLMANEGDVATPSTGMKGKRKSRVKKDPSVITEKVELDEEKPHGPAVTQGQVINGRVVDNETLFQKEMKTAAGHTVAAQKVREQCEEIGKAEVERALANLANLKAQMQKDLEDLALGKTPEKPDPEELKIEQADIRRLNAFNSRAQLFFAAEDRFNRTYQLGKLWREFESEVANACPEMQEKIGQKLKTANESFKRELDTINEKCEIHRKAIAPTGAKKEEVDPLDQKLLEDIKRRNPPKEPAQNNRI